jgi:hypothetical protein
MEPASEPKLTTIDRLAPVVEWPHRWPAAADDSAAAQAPVHVAAELQVKRFGDRNVESNRYTAELTAASSSAHAILSALTEACAQIDELRQDAPSGEPFVFEIRLRG